MTGTEHDGLRGSGATPLEAPDPRRVGPVRVLGRLGAGGMGRVYLGVYEDRYVAVKQVLPSLSNEGELFLRRFGHELDNLARLPADSTAPLLVSDRTAGPSGPPWFATAYVPGITLSDARALCGGALPASALWLLLREAAESLAAVHELGMVHRDLKPSNVMLTPDGATLIDFGVARAADQTQLTRTDMVIGTPAYMAPEQASGKRGGELTGAVDVFALGSVLACAATGAPPFGDESGPAVLYRIVHEEPDLGDLAEVDAELADVVRSCLEKRPEDRPTAAELLRSAAAKGPFTAPLWPEPVAEVVAERAAFAARPVPAGLPETEGPEEPEQPGEPEEPPGKRPRQPEDARDRQAEPAGAAERPKRRTRFLPVIIPVVIGVGTTLAVQLLPYVIDDADADGRASGPGVTASAPATAGGASSGVPSGEASASPSSRPSDEDEDRNKDEDREGEDGTGDDHAGDGGAADGGSGGSGGSGAKDPGADTGSGAGGGSSTGSSGGSSGSSGGSSGGSSSGSSGGGAPGGTAGGVTTGPTIQNASTSRCLVAGQGNASAGSCSGAAASWTFRSVSGGVQIVSQSTGHCLTSYGSIHMAPCGAGDTQVWTRGSTGTLRVNRTGECLGVNGFLLLRQACNGSATQRWL